MDVKIFSFQDGEKDSIDRKALLGLFLLAFLLRLPLLFYPEVIHNDGIEYIRHAKLVLSGDWSGGKAPPLYPALTAFAHLFIPDMERAGILISIIFGSLLVLPVFYLGKEMFDTRVGVLSALLAAVHPSLNISSGSVLTESTYSFLFATSVLFGWKAFNKRGFYSILSFSLFTTLAYLNRPEAIGLLPVFLAWTLFANPLGGERRFAKKIVIILITFAAFFAFSFPYLMNIRRDTGTWRISKKAVLSIGSLSGEEEAPSFGKLRGEKGLTFSSLIKHPLTVLGRMGTGFLGSLYKFFLEFNPLLFFFAVIGWVLLFKKKDLPSWKGNFFLLSHLIFYFGMVFPIFLISRRYASQMIPISLPWAAFGFLGLIERLHRPWWRGIQPIKISALVLIVVLIGLFVQGRVIYTREHRFIQKEAGLWMKDHLPKEARVMSRLPQETFYAERDWMSIPDGSYEEILGVARAKNVGYLIVDDKTEEMSPGFLEKVREADLVRLRDWKKEDQRSILFEVLYPVKK